MNMSDNDLPVSKKKNCIGDFNIQINGNDNVALD